MHTQTRVCTQIHRRTHTHTNTLTHAHTDTHAHTIVFPLAGKGRGLVAKGAIKSGELVLAVQPLAVLHGPHENMPDPLALSPILWQLLQAASACGDPHDLQGKPALKATQAANLAGWGTHTPLLAARWLPLLHRGQPQLQTAGQPQQQERLLPYIQALLHQKVIYSQGKHKRPEGDGVPVSIEVEAAAAEAAQERHLPQLTEADLASILSQNAFGESRVGCKCVGLLPLWHAFRGANSRIKAAASKLALQQHVFLEGTSPGIVMGCVAIEASLVCRALSNDKQHSQL
eukprot:1157914-Pelagomonas_calceolata.AAC.2